ncbi:MAG: DNA topoisomerase I [Legionellales bacterium]|nr:DNA topoisomerase I [Legionellales bacterium]
MPHSTVVVVESPAKCKTVKKHMGSGYTVLASCGHVRDLIPKNGAVETDHDFKMHYQTLEQSHKYLAAISKALKTADTLLLATDPDREGEAIAWHVLEWLKSEKKCPKHLKVQRVVFHQITRSAIQAALEQPRDLSINLIDAQQARRALDYLVGFNLSPLLWKKIRRGLSAGRVQSPALHMIVEREKAIQAFKPEEYWTLIGHFNHDQVPIESQLSIYQGEKQTQFSVTTQTQAEAVQQTIIEAAQGVGTVESIKRSERKRNPAPPFMTSTLQQEAARKLGFTTTRTMRAAQQLYEGVDIGSDTVGLITYMRTDSVHLAQEAIEEIRTVIQDLYGAAALPKTPNRHKSKSKNAQEAHEAIRPTEASRRPEDLKNVLDADTLKLYTLIWKRTLASQMTPALYDQMTVLIDCQVATFKATGSVLKSPGFTAVYTEGHDDSSSSTETAPPLPDLEIGKTLSLKEIEPIQHFTEPPPRFTEASLVKALEEHGIGRPSTYASIIATLKNREYVTLDKKRFYPTDVGTIVSDFLNDYFNQYVSYEFTAQLENQLDAIARGEQAWVPVMREFWEPFHTTVDNIESTVSRQAVTQKEIDEACPECSKPLSIRLGRRGQFIGCTDYPNCTYTRSLNPASESESEPEAQTPIDHACPECGGDLIHRTGRYGAFIGCSQYPKCKYIESSNTQKTLDIGCPQCQPGQLIEKKTRRGKPFYACDQYPTCKYALWNLPIAKACPQCQFPITTVKTTKKSGTERICPEENCDFKEPYDSNIDS